MVLTFPAAYHNHNVILFCLVNIALLWLINFSSFFLLLSKKQDTLLLPITLTYIDLFSKFFHRWTQYKTCNEVVIIEPTAPHTRLYTTL